MNDTPATQAPSDNENGLVTAWLLDGQGGGQRLGWEDIADWRPDHGLIWIHLDYSHPNSLRWLDEESGIDRIVRRVLTSDESRPRCELFESGLLTILRGVNLNPGADPEDMVSVRIWLEERRIISCRHRRLASIADLQERLSKGTGPRSQGSFLAQLGENLVKRMDDVIESLEDAALALEERLTDHESGSLRSEISDTRRIVIHLRRYLAPQRDALKRLQALELDWLSSDARSRLNEIADQTQRYLEGLDAIRDQTQVAQEELTQKLTEQTERRMYVLAIITSVFLPLGFLTGLLGINVGGMPGIDNPIAFWVVCLLALVVGGISLWLLRLMRWF
ncbi:MAG: zinc transporter ZntB [Candidatus Thiodiazotropha sp.]